MEGFYLLYRYLFRFLRPDFVSTMLICGLFWQAESCHIWQLFLFICDTRLMQTRSFLFVKIIYYFFRNSVNFSQKCLTICRKNDKIIKVNKIDNFDKSDKIDNLDKAGETWKLNSKSHCEISQTDRALKASATDKIQRDTARLLQIWLPGKRTNREISCAEHGKVCKKINVN